uniref:R13L1/DRL21-like LRR repeat region domain-containing protein n=1 Tax=Setaria viridis TaxID=4556 RepID=A0A4U6VIK1_SETVI|nr:hypothetical protein SEVIR_3G396601v2 [Setaria viridis]
MWEDGGDNLEKLKQILRHGRKGSKIILTTRMQHVVDKLDVGALADQGIIRPVCKSDQINLSLLSEDDCWNVMRQMAFRRDEDQSGLEAIGRQIAKKCAGLPLLARSLGYLISQYKSTEAWEDIRDKKIVLGLEEDINLQEPLERLMMSYYYMPLKFKLCFTYCAVFPKGFAIAIDHLIHQWRALGYIQPIDGHHCINYLLGMSFLQISKSSQSLWDMPDGIGNMSSLTLFEVSTASYFINNMKAPCILSRLKLQETIVHNVHDVQEEDYGWCSSIVSLGELTCQRLQIEGLHNVKRPEDAEVAKLRDNPDLRELILTWYDARGTENRRDAEVLENLVPPRTLEGFELRGYMSRNFPNWMVDISSYLPYLTSIHLRGLEACDSLPPLGRLPNVRLLHMELIPNIRKIGKEFYGEEGTCKKLRIIQLKGLSNLDEWWTTRSGDEDDEFLIPNLHRLEVHSCPRLKFLPCPPKSMYWELHGSDEVLPVHGFGWISSSTLPFRAEIQSTDFSHDKWGRLQHLTTLEELWVMDSGSFSTFPEASPCFPSLRYLRMSLANLEMLPEWLGQLTTLKQLVIYDCPNLTSLPASIRNLTTLKTLEIWSCPRLIERCKGEDAHKISHIPDVRLGHPLEAYLFSGQPIERSESDSQANLSEPKSDSQSESDSLSQLEQDLKESERELQSERVV